MAPATDAVFETDAANGPPAAAVSVTKRSLVTISHAMERSFDIDIDIETTVPGTAGLVIGLFQRREYFDAEADRYGALAARGHTVVVGFAGSVAGLPPGVHGVSFADDDPQVQDWVLVLVQDQFAGALVAHDRRDLATGESTLQASRLFSSQWTFRRLLALDEASDRLRCLADRMDPVVVAAATHQIERCAESSVSPVEARLAETADYLVAAVEVAQQRIDRMRLRVDDLQTIAERDQLTGLNNRHYLERYLGDGDNPADLVVMLVDVDDLKRVNDTFGHEAGDAVLNAVAATLRRDCRPGDVMIRWGGDEFIVLTPGMSGRDGLVTATRLAEAVHAEHPAAPWNDLAISVSIGVSEARRTRLPLSQLDAALYDVKRTGKGHAVLAPGSEHARAS